MLSERPVAEDRWLTPARVGRLQLVVAVGAGVVVLASAGVGWWRAHGAARAIAAGHGESLLHEVRRAHPATGEGLTSADAAALLRALRDEGLRCLTVFEPDMRVRFHLGDCRLTSDETTEIFPTLEPGRPRAVGDRLLMVHALPPGADAPPPPWGANAPPPPPPGGPHRYPFAIEYDTPSLESLWATTYASLIASAVAAVVLAGGTLLTRRLARQADVLQAALARDRHLAVLGEASAVLAHELRNPLSSLKGHAQLLVEELPSGESPRRRAELVVREAIRLEALCEQLLSFVRANRIEPEEADPATVLRDAAASVDAGRIEIDASAAPRRWRLDPLRLHQALANLLQNAVQASPPEAPCHASVKAENGALVFEVRDHGPGVPASDAEAIFEPFRTTRLRGTGLGLAIARRVVELHGGTLRVHNHAEGGAVFCARIPSAASIA
jgi:two-component system sensor histidine kinase HydH